MLGGPQRNLALELVRVTEAAALAGGRWLGRGAQHSSMLRLSPLWPGPTLTGPVLAAGDKNAADQAAVDQMRRVLNSISMDGIVVIGEGEKDEVPLCLAARQ